MRKKRPDEPRESLIASGWTVEAEPAAAIADPTEPPAPDTGAGAEEAQAEAGVDSVKPQLSNAALVLLGVFGGLYLLYAWIWLSWAQYYAPVNEGLAASAGALGGTAQNIVYWIAPLAPLLWFLTALLMNRGKKLRSLAIWVVLGAIVLIPLPVFDGWGL